jgi:hypothetical protein
MKGPRAHATRKTLYRLLSVVLLLVALGLVGGTSQPAVAPAIGALTPDYTLTSALASVRRHWQSSRTTRRAEQ